MNKVIKVLSIPESNAHLIFFIYARGKTFLGKKMAFNTNEYLPLTYMKNILGKLVEYWIKDGQYFFQYEVCQNKIQSLWRSYSEEYEIEHPFQIKLPIIESPDWGGKNISNEKLDKNESILRDVITEKLRSIIHGMHKQSIIYDPACSTGLFLETIAQNSNVITLASDKSEIMVATATRKKLTKVFTANAMDINDLKVDMLILRFLNQEVISEQDALIIIKNLVELVNIGGYLCMLGFSPVHACVVKYMNENKLFTNHIKTLKIQSEDAICQAYIWHCQPLLQGHAVMHRENNYDVSWRHCVSSQQK